MLKRRTSPGYVRFQSATDSVYVCATVIKMKANGHINRPVCKDRSEIKAQTLHYECKLNFSQLS